MTGPNCPAEGCDYNEEGEKTAASVRRHINAKADDAHSDTEALRSALNSPTEGGNEGAESAPDDSDDEEQGEREDERAEAVENEENEQDEMDQSSEYERQVAQSTEAENSTEGNETEGQQGSDGAQQSALGSAPVAPILAGFALVAIYVLVSSGSSSGDDQPTEVESEVVEESEQAEPVVDDPEAEVAW